MYLFAATAIAAALIAGGGAWKVQDWRYASIEKERIEAQAEKQRNDRKVIDFASVGHEKDKGALRTQFLTITETVEKIVREKFYLPSELCFDDAGLRELAIATGAKPAASQPQGTLPRPGPAN